MFSHTLRFVSAALVLFRPQSLLSSVTSPLVATMSELSHRSITIAVGSKNPVKIKAAQSGTEKVFASKYVATPFGYDVPSGVPEQPIGDDITKEGAINRAKAAFAAHVAAHGSGPTYSIGMEGGVSVSSANEMACFAYMAVYNGSSVGTARTGTFSLPARVRDLILIDGMELGHADDLVFGTSNSKQKGGSVGQLTHSVIDRTLFYEHALILAFVPFHWPDLYGVEVAPSPVTGGPGSNDSS